MCLLNPFFSKTKVAGRHTAASALETYEEAKNIIRHLEEQSQRTARHKELDPKEAAAGNCTAIYKVFYLYNFHQLFSILFSSSTLFVVLSTTISLNLKIF